jgi:hypothetical protein
VRERERERERKDIRRKERGGAKASKRYSAVPTVWLPDVGAAKVRIC